MQPAIMLLPSSPLLGIVQWGWGRYSEVNYVKK